jgi:hypothetical protein
MKKLIKQIPKEILIPFVFLFFFAMIFTVRSLSIYLCTEKINGNQAEWELVYWTLALAVATFILGIVAAFQDIIRGWFSKPILDCKLLIESPHCHRATSKSPIKEYVQNRFRDEIIGYNEWFTYYFRFKIGNKGNISAKNVEVILKDLRDGKGEKINLPLDNLVWSTLEFETSDALKPKMYWDYISPDTYQYCNLGYINEPSKRHLNRDNENEKLKLFEDVTIFGFSIYWRTLDKRYLVGPGIYSFNVIVGSENAKTISKSYKIQITGYWSVKEEEMLERGFKILSSK